MFVVSCIHHRIAYICAFFHLMSLCKSLLFSDADLGHSALVWVGVYVTACVSEFVVIDKSLAKVSCLATDKEIIVVQDLLSTQSTVLVSVRL